MKRLVPLFVVVVLGLVSSVAIGSSHPNHQKKLRPVATVLRTIHPPRQMSYFGIPIRCHKDFAAAAGRIARLNQLFAGDCYAKWGHAEYSDHNLGLAIDIILSKSYAEQRRAVGLAKRLGWQYNCNGTACSDHLQKIHSPLRAISFRGPAACELTKRNPFTPWRPIARCVDILHLSVNHSPALPGRAATWVAHIPNRIIDPPKHN